jgi:hypothetical protein
MRWPLWPRRQADELRAGGVGEDTCGLSTAVTLTLGRGRWNRFKDGLSTTQDRVHSALVAAQVTIRSDASDFQVVALGDYTIA